TTPYGRSRLTWSSASRPLLASTTSKPCMFRNSATAARMSWSSSTTSTFFAPACSATEPPPRTLATRRRGTQCGDHSRHCSPCARRGRSGSAVPGRRPTARLPPGLEDQALHDRQHEDGHVVGEVERDEGRSYRPHAQDQESADEQARGEEQDDDAEALEHPAGGT